MYVSAPVRAGLLKPLNAPLMPPDCNIVKLSPFTKVPEPGRNSPPTKPASDALPPTKIRDEVGDRNRGDIERP